MARKFRLSIGLCLFSLPSTWQCQFDNDAFKNSVNTQNRIKQKQKNEGKNGSKIVSGMIVYNVVWCLTDATRSSLKSVFIRSFRARERSILLEIIIEHYLISARTSRIRYHHFVDGYGFPFDCVRDDVWSWRRWRSGTSISAKQQRHNISGDNNRHTDSHTKLCYIFIFFCCQLCITGAVIGAASLHFFFYFFSFSLRLLCGFFIIYFSYCYSAVVLHYRIVNSFMLLNT